jgi:hypothetical protein
VYHNQGDPSDSFIIKEYDFGAQWGILLFSFFFSASGGILLRLVFSLFGVHEDTWFLRLFSGLLLLWVFGSVTVLIHYWFHAPAPLSRSWAPVGWSVFTALVFLLLAAGAIEAWIRRRRRARSSQ